jgi:hypothetical protein
MMIDGCKGGIGSIDGGAGSEPGSGSAGGCGVMPGALGDGGTLGRGMGIVIRDSWLLVDDEPQA